MPMPPDVIQPIETSASDQLWLNHVVAVASAVRLARRVVDDAYAVR
jgi:hypothetical protein